MNGDDKVERKAWQRWLVVTLLVASYTACVAGFLAWQGQYGWEYWSEALYQSARIVAGEYDGPRPPEPVPLLLHIGRLGMMIGLFLLAWLTAGLLLRERLTPLRLWLRSPEVIYFGITPEVLRIAHARRSAFPGVRQALVTDKASSALAQRFGSEVSRLVLIGDPAGRDTLKRASIRTGTAVLYAAGESDAETLGIVKSVLRQRRESPGVATRLKLAVLLKDRALQQTVDSLPVTAGKEVEVAWLDPVAIAARLLLDRIPPDNLAPPSARIHVLLWGSSPLIEALLLQVARNVYPRPQLTRVTVIADSGFRQKMLERHAALAPDFRDAHLFSGLHPFIEIEWLDRQPATLSVDDLAAMEQVAPLTCAYVDGGADDATLVMSRRLLQLKTWHGARFRVGACLQEARHREGLDVVASDRDVFRYQPGEQYLGQRLDVLAMLNNFAYQPGSSIPDFTAPALEHDAAWHHAWTQWRQMPEWKRQSSRYVADHIPVKLRSIDLGQFLDRPVGMDDARELRQRLQAALPQLGALEHRRYCAERMLDGWLPVSGSLWTPPAPQGGLEAHRERLKGLRLNATLAIKVEEAEKRKDERLAAAIAWMLWMAAHPPGGERLFAQLEEGQSSS